MSPALAWFIAGFLLILAEFAGADVKETVNLRGAEQYVREFGRLARTHNAMIIPASLGDVGGMVGSLLQTGSRSQVTAS